MQNKKLWFKAKRFGWGWYPVALQGWLILSIYIIGIIVIAIHSVGASEVTNATAKTFLSNYIPPLIILSLVMIWICYKTGEKPR